MRMDPIRYSFTALAMLLMSIGSVDGNYLKAKDTSSMERPIQFYNQSGQRLEVSE